MELTKDSAIAPPSTNSDLAGCSPAGIAGHLSIRQIGNDYGLRFEGGLKGGNLNEILPVVIAVVASAVVILTFKIFRTEWPPRALEMLKTEGPPR